MKYLILVLLSALTFSVTTQANPRRDAAPWVSAIDKKYEQRNKVLFDKFAEARELLNGSFQDYDNLDKAKQLLDEVLAQDPKFAPAQREYARYFMRQGYWFDSKKSKNPISLPEKSIQKALKLEPDYVDAYVLLGYVYINLGRYSEAFNVLSKAAEMGTEIPWLALNFAELYEELDKDKLALTIYTNVANRGTPNQKAYIHAVSRQAELLWRARDLDKAKELITYLIDYDDSQADVWAQYSRFALFADENVDQAVAAGYNAVARINSAYYRSILANALYTKWAFLLVEGDVEGSQFYFDTAYEVDPNIEEVIEILDGRYYSGVAAEKLREWLQNNKP